MSEPLTFRTRYDTTLFLLGVLALAGALVSMFSDFALLPGRGYAYACEPWRLHSVVWGSFAAMCIVVCAAQWKRLVIGEECLERHGLLRTRVDTAQKHDIAPGSEQADDFVLLEHV